MPDFEAIELERLKSKSLTAGLFYFWAGVTSVISRNLLRSFGSTA